MLIYIPDFVQSFFDALDITVKAKLLELIKIVRRGDYTELMVHSKKIDGELYELRIKSITHARVFFTFHQGQMLILHAIIKKTWRIPRRELETARKRLKLLRVL